jgi:hypothetical protein
LADENTPVVQIYLKSLYSGKFELSKKERIHRTGPKDNEELPHNEYMVVMQVNTYNMQLCFGNLGTIPTGKSLPVSWTCPETSAAATANDIMNRVITEHCAGHEGSIQCIYEGTASSSMI